MKTICWSLGLLTSFSLLAAPLTVTIDKPTPGETLPKAQLVPIQFTVKNHPTGSSIGFFLRKHVPVSDLPLTPGPEGAIMLYTQELAEYPVGYFNWDGQSFACAPTDAPQLCATPVEPGTYRLEAVVYEGLNVNLAPTRLPRKVKELAHTASAPFKITGTPNIHHAEKNLREGSIRTLRHQFKLDPLPTERWQRYITPEGKVLGPDEAGLYCQRFMTHLPFQGKLSLCAHNEDNRPDVVAGGKLTYSHDILKYEEAKALAAKMIETAYGSRVDFLRPSPQSAISTHLSSTLRDWMFSSARRYWAFHFHVKKLGGTSITRDRFNDSVVVKVGQAACIAKALPMNADKPLTIDEVEWDCAY